MKQTSTEAHDCMRRHQDAKVEYFDVSNVIYHKFSHCAVSYVLNGENVNIILEYMLTLLRLFYISYVCSVLRLFSYLCLLFSHVCFVSKIIFFCSIPEPCLEELFRNEWVHLHICTVQILCIGTDRSQQTVQTKIRLLLKKQSDQGLRCLPFHQHLLDALMQCYFKLYYF